LEKGKIQKYRGVHGTVNPDKSRIKILEEGEGKGEKKGGIKKSY